MHAPPVIAAAGEGHLPAFIAVLALFVLVLVVLALRNARRNLAGRKDAADAPPPAKARGRGAGGTLLTAALLGLSAGASAEFVPWSVEEAYTVGVATEEFQFISCRDLNGDRRADILTQQYDPENDRTILLVYSSRGNLIFQDHKQFNLSGLCRCLPPDDPDGDGRLDLVYYTSKPDTLELWRQAPDYSGDAERLLALPIPGLLGKPCQTAKLQPLLRLPDGKGILLQVATTYGGLPRSILLYRYGEGVIWRRDVPSPAYCGGVVDIDDDGTLELLFGTSAPGNGAAVPDIGDDAHGYEMVFDEHGELRSSRVRGGVHSDVKKRVIQKDGRPAAVLTVVSGGTSDIERGHLEILDLAGGGMKYLTLQAKTMALVVDDLDADGCDDIVLALEDGRVIRLNLALEIIALRQYEIAAWVGGAWDLLADGRREFIVNVGGDYAAILDANLDIVAELSVDAGHPAGVAFVPDCFWLWEGGGPRPAYACGRELTLARLEPRRRAIPSGVLLFVGGTLLGALGALLCVGLSRVHPTAGRARINWEYWHLLYRLCDNLRADPRGRALLRDLGRPRPSPGSPAGSGPRPASPLYSFPELVQQLREGDLLNDLQTIAAHHRKITLAPRGTWSLLLVIRKLRWHARRCDQRRRCHEFHAARIRTLANTIVERTDSIQAEVKRYFTADLGEVFIRAVRITLSGHKPPIETIYRVHPEPGNSVFFERGSLFFICENLLGNAREAFGSTPAPALELTFANRADEVWVDIRDNGPGLPADKVAQLMEESFNREDHGGFGLPRCRYLMNHFGGSIDLLPPDSSFPGAGFRLRFRSAGAAINALDDLPLPADGEADRSAAAGFSA